ncbi:hypothetical protein ACQFYA_01775 [Promicromonospora sp. Marseille-Q5078]
MSSPGPADDTRRVLAGRVRDAVLTVPGVARLSGGVLGEVATYLPGDRIAGVRFDDDDVHVHVVVTAAGLRDVPGVAGAVHAATRQALASSAQEDAPTGGAERAHVVVHVDDVEATGVPGGVEVPTTGTRKDGS